MTECPTCSHRFHADVHHPPIHCPACGALLRVARPSDWAPVARLTNLADTGYFSDVLEQHEIDVQIKEIDEYSALLGLWESVYVLQVPRDDTQRAVDLMNEHAGSEREVHEEPSGNTDSAQIDANADFEPWSSQALELDWPNDGASTGSTPIWKSVAIVLVASGIAYSVGHTTGRHDTDTLPAGDRDQLWQVLSQPGESFVSEGPPGARRYRLQFDARTNRIEMDEDIDGDGQYDRRRVFERGRLVSN